MLKLRLFLRRPSNGFLMALCLALAIALLVVSLLPPQFDQRPNINTDQNSKKSIESDQRSKSGGTSIDSASSSYRDERKNEASEFWPPIFGYRVKITDSLLVFFTFTLWLATRALVVGVKDTTQRQLRAYIGHEPMGFHWMPAGIVNPITQKQTLHKMGLAYYEMNHGLTPATNVAMYIRLTRKPPTDYSGPFKRLAVMQMIHPKQNIGKMIFLKPASKRHPFTQDREFYVYGYVDYEDVFLRKWRRRFAFRHTAVTPA